MSRQIVSVQNFPQEERNGHKNETKFFYVFVLLLTLAILSLTSCSSLNEIFNKTTSEEYKTPD